MKRINTSELPPEQQVEAEAAFGEDTTLIQFEPDDLEEVETPDFILKHILEEGDWITIQHQAGNVTTGPVTEVQKVGFNVDPRNRTTSGYYGYGDFICEGTDELGIVNKIIDINGEPGERVLERRVEDE